MFHSTQLPTTHGDWIIRSAGFGPSKYSPHLILSTKGLDFESDQTMLVRIHSECITGDVFGSLRCDCGEQLHTAMDQIQGEGGIVLYMRQEGRGIGIEEKLKAYKLQDDGLDTYEANLQLGHGADERCYKEAIAILTKLGVQKIKLLTNNPKKIDAIEKSEISLIERLPIIIPSVQENKAYLKSKQTHGHLF